MIRKLFRCRILLNKLLAIFFGFLYSLNEFSLPMNQKRDLDGFCHQFSTQRTLHTRLSRKNDGFMVTEQGTGSRAVNVYCRRHGVTQ
ncbi:hypothetical protein QWZ13_06165 [Reinekea marina]|uniref:hypothetical protein n=1 Tax=Reinekea marina TaxID=1310421 RepID=UPI0025B58797|nr:hypothetical protein [Reinekea marina]MDN3648492.1 hypothetical protein [Reinekea marina]